MSEIKSKLEDDLKQAMRERDVLRRDVIRYIRSEIRNQEIRLQRDLEDADAVQVLSRQAQQRRDSIEAFQKANRQDLVDKERAELGVIAEYLPQQMSEAEIDELASATIAEVGATGPRDMGKVMSAIMPQVRGRAEGKAVSALVSAKLRSL